MAEDSVPTFSPLGESFAGRDPQSCRVRSGIRQKPFVSENFEDIQRHACQVKASVNVPRQAAGPGMPNIVLLMDVSVIIQVYWQLQHFP